MVSAVMLILSLSVRVPTLINVIPYCVNADLTCPSWYASPAQRCTKRIF